MIISKIVLENFRQYKSKCLFCFSVDPQKNVTVITGDNTCGKTTLVQAFIWCLYGTSEFKDKIMLNAEVLDELKELTAGAIKECSVRVCLNHNGIEYEILRSEKYSYTPNGKIHIEPSFKMLRIEQGNASTVFSEDIGNTIEKILPEKLSSYFFFWGEKIEKLSERKELESAVKQFLGLDTINQSIKHLELAIKKMRRDLSSDSSDFEIQKYQKKIDDCNDEIKKFQNELDNINTNLDYFQDKKNRLDEELRSSENRELNSKQNEFKNKSKYLVQRQEELSKSKEQFSKIFNDSKNYVYYYSAEMEKNAVELLKNNPEPVVGWNHIDLSAINEILKRGKCVCGNEICENSEAHKYLLEQQKLVSPNVIGGVINSFIEESERRNTANECYYDLLHREYKNIIAISDEVSILEYDVAMLEKLLSGTQDMGRKISESKEVEQKIKEYSRRKGELSVRIENSKNDIEKYNRYIDNLATKDKKHKNQLKQIKYAEQILEIFTNEYKEKESLIKEKLNMHVNENFSQVYSGKKRIEIDDKYNAIPYNLVGDQWIINDTSPGLETVKNFAFIVGLVQCAKDKVIESDDDTVGNSGSYPLVLDAPFSQADENHIPQISKLISDNAEQIILVVMNKDWNYAKNILKDKVGAFYELEKETETCTHVKEISIND